jgi:hypothetical protein
MAFARHPTDFDIALDSERGRWLRKRFLWFCAVNMLLAAPFLHGALKNMLAARGSVQVAAIVWHGTFLLTCFLFAGALIYGWRSPPSRRQMVALAVWLSCVTGVMSLLALRIAVRINPLVLHISNAPHRPGSPPPMAPEAIAMFLALYLVLQEHLLTCPARSIHDCHLPSRGCGEESTELCEWRAPQCISSTLRWADRDARFDDVSARVAGRRIRDRHG